MSKLSSKIILQNIEDLKKVETSLKSQIELLKTEIDQTEGEDKIGLYNDFKTLEATKEFVDDALGQLEQLF